MDNDELMKAIDQAAATAERDGDAFILRQQINRVATDTARAFSANLSIALNEPLTYSNRYNRENLQTQVAEVITIILTRELLGE